MFIVQGTEEKDSNIPPSIFSPLETSTPITPSPINLVPIEARISSLESKFSKMESALVTLTQGQAKLAESQAKLVESQTQSNKTLESLTFSMNVMTQPPYRLSTK